MDGISRFFDNPVTSVSLRTAFPAEFESERMKRVRPSITTVRQRWETTSGYLSLVQQVKALCDKDTVLAPVRASLDILLEGYRDYADIDLARPFPPRTEYFEAIEFYCSKEGYEYITRLIQLVFRKTQPSADELVRATTFVEWITIDLYNLRLSQIGDPRFENFQGVVYRWFSLSVDEVNEYRGILRLTDHSKRNYSIPLGFVSTAADSEATRHFGEIPSEVGGQKRVRIRQTVHVHGMDPAVLDSFRQQYPDSVVTSICAMPVARMSAFGEQEILLRGPFFHLIAIRDGQDEKGAYTEFVTVCINSNRDHGSEHASDEGEKARQRAAFFNAVNASKWEVCARVAEEFSVDDARAYGELQERTVTKLANEYGINAVLDGQLAQARSPEVAVWLGDMQTSSYPGHYSRRRRAWEKALSLGNWVEAEKVVEKEYSWRRTEWYNVGKLIDEDELHVGVGENFTLLHELVRQAPKEGLATELDNDNYRAWRRLVDAASGSAVWKSLRSFDDFSITAAGLALKQGLLALAERLQPKILHPIETPVLDDLQNQLRSLMHQIIGQFTGDTAFHYPQLSVLQELEHPKLWIPITGMQGGFLVELQGRTLEVTVFETLTGKVGSYETVHQLHPKVLDLQ